jgi:probable rRNA maturation factor
VPFYFQSISQPFKVKQPLKIKQWLHRVFQHENIQKSLYINFVFCSDDELLEINRTHLNHDYYTDIITFPIEETDSVLEAEIYISIDRVKENAENESVSFDNELKRVIVHGILHLCGYKDKTTQQQKNMRQKEDFYLSQF